MVYGIVDVHFFFLFSFFSFFFFFHHDFVRPISLELLLAETPNWVCCLVLLSNCALLLTIQFASLFFFLFFLFFRQDLVRAISLEPLLAETPNWVCCLFLRSNFALLLTIQFALLFFFLFFHHDFVRAISLEPLLAENPNWVCCLVLRSDFALLLTIQLASLISSLINIISLLLTTFDWTKVRGIAPRSHKGRPRTCLLLLLTIPVGDAIWDCRRSFFFSFFSATILSGPYLWNRYSQRLQIECAAWSCGLIVHCCLPSNSLRYFFFFLFINHDFFRAISLEPLLAETPNWVCCLVLRSNFALLLTIQFASLFFFSATCLSGPYLWNR